MKIRIRGNSIRVRLQKQELGHLLERNQVVEQTSIGSRTFYYAIESSDSAPTICATFNGEGILISAPREMVRNWAASEELSLYGEQPEPTGVLKILVEKDLKCIKPRSSPLWEDESDAYPNPNTSCGGTP